MRLLFYIPLGVTQVIGPLEGLFLLFPIRELKGLSKFVLYDYFNF